MFDHLTLTVRDIEKSKSFYRAALAPLGCDVRMEFGTMCGIGPAGKPGLWLKPGDPPTTPMHLAFSSGDRPAVDSFYAAALAAGATDNGPPGLRPDYHPTYYAAFVIDPDGHNVEVVCHRAPGAAKPGAGARRKARAPARSRRAPARKGSRGRKPRKRR
jgi:catechol 2,3-dioxygenase-like lactoylglutathione lyase family enzyme